MINKIFIYLLLSMPLHTFAEEIDLIRYDDEAIKMSNVDYIDLIRTAVIDQPDFKELLSRKTTYDFEFKSERAERFPTIKSSIRNDRIIDRKIDDFSSIRKRQDDSTDIIVELSQPLYSGGIINKRIDNARKQKIIGNLELKKQASELVIRANQIYLDLIRYTIYYNYLEKSIREIQEILKNVETRIQAGFANVTEKALVQIRLNELLILRTSVEAQLIRSKETFARFFNKEFEKISIPELKVDNLDTNNFSNDKSYDLLISEISYEQEKNNLSIVRGEYLPKIGLNFRYIQYDFDEDFDENDIRGGLTFSVPIFDFGRLGNKVKASRARVNEYKWAVQANERDYIIGKSEIQNRLFSTLKSVGEIKNTIDNTRQQKDILISRMGLSEFNGVNLSEIILQDVSNADQLLQTELQLYFDDLKLSHINGSLLNRFRLDV